MRNFRVLLALSLAIGIGLMGVMATAAQKSAKPSGSPNSGLLSGRISSGNGQAEEGITVSARLEGSPITTSVYTDSDGLYIFPRLEKGKYQVWAQAVGLDISRTEVQLDGTSAARRDFLLKPAKDIGRQMTGTDWYASLPEETIQDRRMKNVFFTSCAGCHQPSYPLQNRFDQAGWLKIIDVMKMVNIVGIFTRKTPMPFLHYHQKDLSAYLGRVRGPGASPWTPKIVSRPKGEATLAVITEYNIQPAETPGQFAAQDGSNWSEGVPSSMNGSRGTHEVELDFAGNIWIGTSQDNEIRTYGKIDPKTGVITNYKMIGPSGKIRTNHGMRRDAKGMLWLTVSGGDASRFEAQLAGLPNGVQSGTASLVRVDPATGKAEIFNAPPDTKGVSNDAVEIDGKGKVWVSANTGAYRFDPDTGKFIEFKSPQQESKQGITETYGVAADSQGNGYWTQMAIDVVAKGEVATGKSIEIKMPPRKEKLEIVPAEDREAYTKFWQEFNSSVPWTQGPRRMNGDIRGNAVWVANFWGDNLSKIDPRTNKITQYPIPAGTGIYATIVDKNHMVWATNMNNDSVSRFDPATGKWVEFMLPTRGAESRHIAIDDRQYPPTIAVPYSRSSKVAVLRFRTKQDLQALKSQVETEKLQARN